MLPTRRAGPCPPANTGAAVKQRFAATGREERRAAVKQRFAATGREVGRQDGTAVGRCKETHMRNLLALIGLLVVGFAGVGWYMGWYKLSFARTTDGNLEIKTDVDTKKVGQDTS